MKNKKKIIIICSIILFIVISLIVGLLVIKHNNKKNKLDVVLNENIEINFETELKYEDLVKDITNGELVDGDVVIINETIGEKEVTVKVKDKKDRIHEYNVKYNVIDDSSPVITYNDSLSTTEGEEIDLLKDVSASDNYDEDVEVVVEGEYDFNKNGTYTIYYVAKDSSGNETKEEATLIVKEKKVVQKPAPSQSSNNKVEDKTFTTSKGFSGKTVNGVTYIDGVLIANKTYSVPESYSGGSSTKGLTSDTYNAFTKMQAAASIDGISIYVQSGYRSYSTQKRLYNNYVNRDGKAAADTYSARPGNSEHQTGLGFDVCSNNTSACINDGFNGSAPANWLSENAYKYGFILRYPSGKTSETGYKYESWHFRYVGVDLATKLYNNGDWITLEDYFGITSEYND